MSQIEDISMRMQDGLGLKVAYDSDVAWPMTWYLRDYTNQSYYGDKPTRESLDAPVVISGPSTGARSNRCWATAITSSNISAWSGPCRNTST